MRIKIKPLSVNAAWKGKRYRSDDYKKYAKILGFMLPKLKIPKGKIRVDFIFGFSSKGSDWDNPVKPLQDILAKKYSFNDNRIYQATVKKVIVKKGEEFIDFKIIKYEG